MKFEFLSEMIVWAKRCPTIENEADIKEVLAILRKHNKPFLIGTSKEVGRGKEDKTNYMWCMWPTFRGKDLLAPIITL
jgi:hypothetical protein